MRNRRSNSASVKNWRVAAGSRKVLPVQQIPGLLHVIAVGLAPRRGIAVGAAVALLALDSAKHDRRADYEGDCRHVPQVPNILVLDERRDVHWVHGNRTRRVR
jgi:hypothetical protein